MVAVSFGQLVIGPPGSGKSTYCEGMRQLMQGLNRPCLVVNMDFANDWAVKLQHARESYGALCEFAEPDVDVRKLATVTDIMAEHHLGPNGALIYAYKLLAQNVAWLHEQIDLAKRKMGQRHGKILTRSSSTPVAAAYLLFDMPGQVELYTVEPSLRFIMKELNAKDKGLRAVAVHLVDATLCSSIDHYIAALLVSLTAQMSLELPFLNVFTKVDLIKEKDLADGTFSFEWFSRVEDLQFLLPVAHPRVAEGVSADSHNKATKYAKFHAQLLELVEDFSLVSFLPLNIEDKEMALAVLNFADQANGYSLSAYQRQSKDSE